MYRVIHWSTKILSKHYVFNLGYFQSLPIDELVDEFIQNMITILSLSLIRIP